MSELLEKVKQAAEQAAGSPVSHRETVPVVETFRGQTIWDGAVEVFDVANPPPTTVYGWAVESDQGPQFVAVLENPPVDSPITAVRAWIVSQARK